MPRHGLFEFHTIKLISFYASLFLLLLLSLVNLPLLGTDGGKLSFLLIGIYFWTIYRPSLLTYPLVFVSGFLLDFLSGGLVGLYTLCFMVMVMIVRGQRRFLLGQSWPVVWAGYCVAITVVTFIQFFIYSALSLTLLPLIPVGFNLLISFLLYPLLLPPMIIFNRFLAD